MTFDSSPSNEYKSFTWQGAFWKHFEIFNQKFGNIKIDYLCWVILALSERTDNFIFVNLYLLCFCGVGFAFFCDRLSEQKEREATEGAAAIKYKVEITSPLKKLQDKIKR